MKKQSDKFVKENHPFDRGYWRRYDGNAIRSCRSREERAGWSTLDLELESEDLQP